MQRHPVHLAKVTRFDAVQRSEQWKRRIDKEERLCFGTSDALSTARTATPTSMVRMPMDAQSPIRVQRPAGASFSTGSGFASAAPQSCHAGEEVPSARHYAAAGEQQTDRYGDAGAGVLRSRSSSRRGPPSVVSLGSARSSVLSRAGLRTTRSTTTLDSLPTSASNLTAIALQRLDRLEKVRGAAPAACPARRQPCRTVANVRLRADAGGGTQQALGGGEAAE